MSSTEADHTAIQGVLNRYAIALDARDFELLRTCFADRAEATYGGVGLPAGADNIVGWLRGGRALLATMHFMGLPDIEIDGDRATTVTYAVAYLVDLTGDGDEARLRTRGIRYEDQLVRDRGRWVIEHRVHAAVWETDQQAVNPPRPPAAR